MAHQPNAKYLKKFHNCNEEFAEFIAGHKNSTSKKRSTYVKKKGRYAPMDSFSNKLFFIINFKHTHIMCARMRLKNNEIKPMVVKMHFLLWQVQNILQNIYWGYILHNVLLYKFGSLFSENKQLELGKLFYKIKRKKLQILIYFIIFFLIMTSQKGKAAK